MSEPAGLYLAAYHVNAVQQIADFLGNTVDVVAAYPRFERVIPKAVTLQLDRIGPENPDDAGTEQWHCEVRLVAHVFVSFLDSDPELEVRKIASKLAAWIYGRRFGCPVGPAKIVDVSPDGLDLPGKTGRDGEAEDYEVFRIEWTHEAFLGESACNHSAGAMAFEVWALGPDGGTPLTDGEDAELSGTVPTPSGFGYSNHVELDP